MSKEKSGLRIAMLGHKRIPSREGGVEVVVEELATRMAAMGHSVIYYNRRGHHVSGAEFDGTMPAESYKGVSLRTVWTRNKEVLRQLPPVLRQLCAVLSAGRMWSISMRRVRPL